MYEQIARNKRASWLLMAVIVVMLVSLGYVFGLAWFGSSTGGIGLLGVFGIAAIVWSLVGYYSGASIVLAVSGARRIGHDEAPVLWNVVEEMAIAGGLPMPAVYVIDQPAPNALATGRDPKHAAIAVTSGLLSALDREQLQGVVAHEMSHVRNLDIRFATLVGILVGVIALVSDFFLRSTFFGRGRGSGGGSAGAIFVLIAVVLALLAPFAAYAVQFAISRRREYLADASAVELTRDPAGLRRALETIAADPTPLGIANRATAHLFIANPLKRKKTKQSAGLFDTHPPIHKRIEILRAMEHGAGPQASPAAPTAAAAGPTSAAVAEPPASPERPGAQTHPGAPL